MFLLGCFPDYSSECKDNSDELVCPASACHGNDNYFSCSDGKYCIWKYLVCDGYAQCEDKSGNFHSSTLHLILRM